MYSNYCGEVFYEDVYLIFIEARSVAETLQSCNLKFSATGMSLEISTDAS